MELNKDKSYRWMEKYIQDNKDKLFVDSGIRPVSQSVKDLGNKIKNQPRYMLYVERKSAIDGFKRKYGEREIDGEVRAALWDLIDTVVMIDALLYEHREVELFDIIMDKIIKEFTW